MATCKEDNDQVDGYRVAPSSTQSSDDCTLDDGNDSDGESGDSSSSSVTDSTDGIHVVIHYKRKVAKRLMDFNRPQFIPLSFEQYLKWQFIHWNPTWRQDKILELQKIGEKTVITGEVVELFLGKQTNDPDFDRLVEDIKQILLSNTDSIVISWFPLKASYADTDIYEILTGNIQQSGLGMKQEIFTDLTGTHLIRCIHEEKHKAKVDELISKSLLDYTKKQKQGYHSMKQKLPLVFHQIFESNNVKKEAHKAFPAVSVFFDVIESEDELAMKLKGPINNVQDLYEWIKDKYIDPYVCEELNFDEIEHSDEVLDVSSVAYETLETNTCTGLYWYINKFSKKVLLCSLSKTDVNNAVQTAKQSIKKLQKQMKHIQVEDAELMMRDLMGFEEVNGGTVSVTAMTSRDETIIYCMGGQDELNHLKTWFDAYRQTSLEMSTDTTMSASLSDLTSDNVKQQNKSDDSESKENEKHTEFEYSTAENVKVYAYEANILKLPVDCIVNAANSSLQHGSGVARVIAQAAGRQLDQDGFTHIRNHGEVPVGKTYVTTAGRLHYDCVIHAVGPCWSDYYPHSLQEVQQCERDLYSALMESFEAAESRGLKSIALPAISTAIFAVPEELCVYHYAKATLDYSRKSTNSPKPLKEIHFIDINPRIIRSIQKMFKAMFKQGDSLDYFTEKFVKTRTSPSRGPDTWQKQENTKETKSDKFKPVYYIESGTHIFESEKSKLFIQSGDLMKVKADAIVSIEDLDGSGKGKIAELILKKVPVQNMDCYIRSKKSLFRSSSTKRGDVYGSFGYECGYRDVLHAVLPYEIRHESPEDRKAVISLAVKNVLKTMTERSLYSVVMCLMGAGKETKEDVRIAADAFIHAYQEYCLSWQYRTIQIKLVCRLQSVMDNVMEKFGEYGWMGIRPPLPPRPTHSTGVGNMDLEEPVSLEKCVICMDKITDREVLQCGHAFDKDCIDQAFKVQKKCPTCGKVYGMLIGDQPADGRYYVHIDRRNHCAGYERYGRIAIKYIFPDGTQGPDHPNPGKRYKGITRTGYLPDIADGREVLEMLKIAFNRKLTFTIGSSRTSGEEEVITWNDIHHKTDPKPNTQFGYPDPTYLDRVRDELSAKGVTTKDIIQKKY